MDTSFGVYASTTGVPGRAHSGQAQVWSHFRNIFLKDLRSISVFCYLVNHDNILSWYIITKDVAHSSRHHGVISEKKCRS